MTSRLADRLRLGLRRPLAAGGALLLIYIGLSFLMDSHGYLGTDTGAKVATLETMKRDHTFDPDVGYWAAGLDPTGALHPLYQTRPRAEGRWVAVTTLPVLQMAYPLYVAGGYRAALLLPMLGAVGVAFAARALARRVGATDQGWRAFWLVGLGSPIAVYALDFWEHSIGVACMVGAVVLLLDAHAGRSPLRALAAGALLGFAAVLRNETLVYAFVAVGAVCLHSWVQARTPVRALRTGVLAVLGFSGPWFANVVLERSFGAPSRAGRATGTAVGAAASVATGAGSSIRAETDLRVRDALQTLTGLNAGAFGVSFVLGVVVVGVLLAAVRAEVRGDRRFAVVCIAAAAAVYLADAAGGLGFVSGLLPAFPIAIGAIVTGWRPEARLVTSIAVGALPIVYLTQYTGGAAPQWGGRYTLTSAVLLGVVGLVGLAAQFPTVTRGLIVLSLGVTALGVVWLGERSRATHQFFTDLVAEAEPIVISRNAFLLREGGAVTMGQRWLSVSDEAGFLAAIDVARDVQQTEFSVLEWDGDAPPTSALPPGVEEIRRVRLAFLHVPVGLVTYRFTDATP